MPADYHSNGIVTSRSGGMNKIRSPSVRNGPSTSDEDQSSAYSSLNRRNLRLPAYAFILPNLDKFPEDFRRFIERDIIEIGTLHRLESSGHLNWWCGQNNSNQKLLPLITTGDGNCLLHAASLGIWGVHDRQLNLRQLLHEALTVSERRSAFFRRWRWSETKANLKSELILTETEWNKEWKDILNLSAATPRVTNTENGANNEQTYESLEAIHVYALSNVLKRPIIVVSDTVLRNSNNEALSPIPFGGVYLPLEINPHQCHRSPLVLCYDSSHFSPLCPMKQVNTNSLQCVPIVDRNRNLLPIHFAVDPGPLFNWWRDAQDQAKANELDSLQTDDKHLELICKYMDVVKMDLRRGSKTVPVQNGYETTVPQKLLTLASGNESNNNNGHASRIFTEIRQHFRWLSKRSKRKHNRPLFSATELRQSNCLLTVLLHNFSHRYSNAMLENYISGAKERFDRGKLVSPSAVTPKKHRISRSFSSSSVLLTCINNNCNKTASPSNNFLCSTCFEDQKREMMSIGSNSTNASPSSMSSHKENGMVSPTNVKVNQEPITIPYTNQQCSKSITMPTLSQVNASRVYYNGINQHRNDDAPIRYVDESTSASSTMSSRNGTRYISPPTILTRYFYEKDDEYENEPTVLANRPYRTSFDYDTPPVMSYSSSPPYRHFSTSHTNGRIQSPMFYTAPHSLPRVSLNSYRNHEYTQQRPSPATNNYPSNLTAPNVSYVQKLRPNTVNH